MSQIIFTKDIHESIITITEELHTMNDLKEQEIETQKQILEILSEFEKDTVSLLTSIQKTVKKIDLSWITIQDASRMLVELYSIDRTVDNIVEKLPQTQVYHEDGRFLGNLIDNEEVGSVVLSTRIIIGSKIRALEHRIQYLTSRMIIC